MREAEDKESPNSVVLVVHCPWCSKQEASVTIGIANYRWRIHKCLLVRRSSYFERVLRDDEAHQLPVEFPGGAATLDSIVSFCFDSRVPVIRPWNVVALRCAAEFLGMNDRSSNELNLAQKADSYLTRTVLRSWPHTLLVLSDCYNSFMPLAEEIGLVSRCLEALTGFISTSFGSGSGSSGGSYEHGETSWWIDDIVRIPAAFFARMITLLRGRSVCERLLGEAVIKWSEIWLFNTPGNDCSSDCQKLMVAKSWNSSMSSFGASSSPEDDRFLDGELDKMVSKDASPRNSSSGEEPRSLSPDLQLSVQQQQKNNNTNQVTAAEKLELLQGIVQVLPYDRAAFPISFLFLLLRYAFAMDASSECKSQIESRISLQLENASLDDFLMPFKSPSREDCRKNSELDSMKKIISRFLTQHHRNALSASSDHQLMCGGGGGGNKMISSSNLLMPASPVASTPCFSQQQQTVCAVSRVWDQYLTEIACDDSISVQKFTELVEVVPAYARSSHDQLYMAIHIFLKAHVDVSPLERTDVCRALNCLKLSQEVCIQAVQNELMPLRTIVQAMFMQQLQTRNAIDSHFLRGNLRLNQNSPVFQAKQDEQLRIPVVNLEKNDDHEQEIMTEDLKETNTRLQSLEAAMAQMRKSLRENTSGSKLSDVLERNNNNEMNESCSSSSSGSSSQPHNSDSSKRKRWFFRKSSSGRRRGVTRIARLFQKMGFLGLCKTATRSSVDFTPEPPAPNGCLNIDQKNFRRAHKKSWDESDFSTKQSRHSRHHSVA